MNHHARRPVASTKRKERENHDFLKPSSAPKKDKPSILATPPAGLKAPEPALNNQLLAGYLAHEFLTKGTLLGQPWDPARAEAAPFSASASASASAELRRMKGSSSSSQKWKAEIEPVEKKQRYVQVADLFKEGGAHLPGIVNPTQLVRFLHL